jgi:transposase
LTSPRFSAWKTRCWRSSQPRSRPTADSAHSGGDRYFVDRQHDIAGPFAVQPAALQCATHHAASDSDPSRQVRRPDALERRRSCDVRRSTSRFRERAVRLVREQRDECPCEFGAMRSVAAKHGVGSAEALPRVRRAEVHSGARPGLTTAEHEQVKALRREVAELRRANEILKARPSDPESPDLPGRVRLAA